MPRHGCPFLLRSASCSEHTTVADTHQIPRDLGSKTVQEQSTSDPEKLDLPGWVAHAVLRSITAPSFGPTPAQGKPKGFLRVLCGAVTQTRTTLNATVYPAGSVVKNSKERCSQGCRLGE